MSFKEWEARRLRTDGAEKRAAEIEDELRLALRSDAGPIRAQGVSGFDDPVHLAGGYRAQFLEATDEELRGAAARLMWAAGPLTRSPAYAEDPEDDR